MANTPKTGNEAMSVPPHHGQADHVVLRVDIHRDLKTDLVFAAEAKNKTIKQIVIEALTEYLR